jgi:hypothetical protein
MLQAPEELSYMVYVGARVREGERALLRAAAGV